MALNVKNPETLAGIRELAERTGESQLSALGTAIRDRLSALDAADDARASRVDVAARELAAEFTPEERTALRSADSELYDADGLPA